MQLADWDGDGDVDVLLADAGPELLVTFYESLANDSFQAHELLRLPLEDTPVDIEVGQHGTREPIYIDIEVGGFSTIASSTSTCTAPLGPWDWQPHGCEA